MLIIKSICISKYIKTYLQFFIFKRFCKLCCTSCGRWGTEPKIRRSWTQTTIKRYISADTNISWSSSSRINFRFVKNLTMIIYQTFGIVSLRINLLLDYKLYLLLSKIDEIAPYKFDCLENHKWKPELDLCGKSSNHASLLKQKNISNPEVWQLAKRF